MVVHEQLKEEHSGQFPGPGRFRTRRVPGLDGRRTTDNSNLIYESNPAADLTFGYTGKLFDEFTGLQNNLNRWYDPNLGKWISQDPIGFNAGDANLYRYVGNWPTSRVDPDGLQEREIPTMQADDRWFYERWWDNFWGRVNARESLVEDPRGYSEVTFGGKTYFASNDPGGLAPWIGGNLYHRTPIGGVVDKGAHFIGNPAREVCETTKETVQGVIMLPLLPSAIQELPDYQRQDFVINSMLGAGLPGAAPTVLKGALRLPARPSTNNPFSMREVRRRWWGGPTPVRSNPGMPRGREYMELSHTYIANNGWLGRALPDSFKNRSWNLNPMWGSQHALGDPDRYNFMRRNWKLDNPLPSPFERLWQRMPNSHRAAGGIIVLGGCGLGTHGITEVGEAQ